MAALGAFAMQCLIRIREFLSELCHGNLPLVAEGAGKLDTPDTVGAGSVADVATVVGAAEGRVVDGCPSLVTAELAGVADAGSLGGADEGATDDAGGFCEDGGAEAGLESCLMAKASYSAVVLVVRRDSAAYTRTS